MGRSEYLVRCPVQCDKWLTRLLKTVGAELSGTRRNGLNVVTQVYERKTCARLLANAVPFL